MHKDTSTKLIFRKSTRRLLIPFLLFLLLGLLLDGWIQYMKGPGFNWASFIKGEIVTILKFALLWPTGASWFLLSLFVARISFNILHKWIHPLIITMAFAYLAYAVHVLNEHAWKFIIMGHNSHLIIPTIYMGNMCHGLSVYSLGYYLKKKQFNNVIFALAFTFFVLKYFFPATIDFRANNPYGTNFMLAVLYGMSGCIVINNIFKRFCNMRFPFVTYIGCNSMVYYLVHYPVMFVTLSLFWEPFAEKELWFRFLILSLIVTVFLFIAEYIFRVKKLRFMLGE